MEKYPYNLLKPKLNANKLSLPFLPDHIEYSGCKSLLLNGGLFTPCCKSCKGPICGSCIKYNNPEKYGVLKDRFSVPYISPKHKKVISYHQFIKKQKYTLNDINLFLSREQIDVQFTEPIIKQRHRSPSTDSEELI